MVLSDAYLFETNTREQLARWLPSLERFRYCRAVGGLGGGDADELVVALAVPDRAALERVLGVLGVPVVTLGPGVPRVEPGRTYTGTEYAALPKPTEPFPDVEQPGHVVIAGARAFAWVSPGRLELSVVDPEDPYAVTDRSVAAARWIEPLLAPLAADVIDPPRRGEHCITPGRYPALWPS